MNRFFLCLFLCLALAGCRGSKTPTPTPTLVPTPTSAPPPYNTAIQDDYAVYTAVLPAPGGPSIVYAIQQATLPQPDDLALPEGVLPALLSSTLSNFNTQNRQSYPLGSVFTGKDLRYTLVDRARFYARPTAANGLTCSSTRTLCFNAAKFQAAYPEASGITQLSRIGYNSGHTQALVTVTLDDGSNSLITEVYLLTKFAGQWQIIDHYEIQSVA